MNKNSLISVIIPMYNAEKYINDCLESIIKQSYTNIEILVVNDGSTDHSMDIVNTFCDERIHIIHKKNEGVSSARNAGLAASHGEGIFFVDADDYINPLMIEHMVMAMCNYDVDLVSCQYYVVEDGQNKESVRPDKIKARVLTPFQAIELGLERSELPTMSWAKLYKKEVLWKDMYPIGICFEDNYCFNRIISRCKSIYMLNEYLYYYRMVETSITHGYSLERVKSALYVHRYVYDEICNMYPQFIEKAKSLYVQKLYNNYYILRKQCEDKNHPDYEFVKQEILKELKSFKYDKMICFSLHGFLNTHPKLRYAIGCLVVRIRN